MNHTLTGRVRLSLLLLAVAGCIGAVSYLVTAATPQPASAHLPRPGEAPHTGDADFPNFNYVIQPHANSNWIGGGEVGNGRSGAALTFIMSRPSATKAAKDDRTTFSYLPHQYFIVSPTPYFEFEMRGGRLAGETEALDFVDTTSTVRPDADTVRYEIYQLANATAGAGRGQRLASINANASAPGNTNFPAIDTSGGRATRCSGPGGEGGWNCWETFRGNRDGIFHYNRGYRDLTAANGQLAGVQTSKRFSDPRFPQYNGYYVFLLKVIQKGDADKGYVSQVNNLGTDGCPDPTPPNSITCPSYTRATTNNETDPSKPGYPNRAKTVLLDSYFLRAPKDYGGANVQIATAPVSLATGLRVQKREGEERRDFEYAGLNGGNPPNGGAAGVDKKKPYTGLRFSPSGITCRSDGWSTGKDLFHNPRGVGVTNADWDGFNGNDDGYERKPAKPPTPRGPEDAIEIGAKIKRGAYSRTASPVEDISDGWKNDLWTIPISKSEFSKEPWANGAVEIDGWNTDNHLSVGNVQYTWGTLPPCEIGTASQTPRAEVSGYRYNGRDAFTVNPSGNVEGRLTLRSSAFGGKARYAKFATYINGVYRATSDWRELNHTTDSVADAVELDLPPGQQRWTTCVMRSNEAVSERPLSPTTIVSTTSNYVNQPRDGGLWRCSNTILRVNAGPTAKIDKPKNGEHVQYNCAIPGFITGQLTNPDDSARVGAQYTAAWSSGGQTNVVTARSPTVRGSGASFSSDDVIVGSWRVNGAAQSVPAKTTLTRFLHDHLPDSGADVNVALRGYDVAKSSDLNTGLTGDGSYVHDPNQAANPIGTSPTGPNGYKWGKSDSLTFHFNSKPAFTAPTSGKKFLVNGAEVKNIVDGQTVEVRTTVRNTGETPAKFYDIKDYLGSLRDFERPFAIKVQTPGGERFLSPEQVARAVKAVEVQDKQDPNDQANPKGNGDRAVAISSDSDPKKDAIPTNRADARLATWKFDLGDNQRGLLKDLGAPAELKAGESIVLTYSIRTDRNRVTASGTSADDNYHRRYKLGEPGVPASPDPAKPQRTERGDIDLSQAHVYVQFQEDYCDDANRKVNVLENRPSDVLAPFVRGGRGSIGSNGNIFGFDGLGDNATFTITASGAISHFTSTSGNRFGNYRSGGTPCRTDGKLDWRKEMVENVNRLKQAPRNTDLSSLLSTGNLKGPNGNVWETGDLHLSGDPKFKGIGTIVVNGDLFVDADFSYADDSNLSSLGMIVLGDLKIKSTAQKMVGSYYVSDVKRNAQNALPVDGNGCPQDINTAPSGPGQVDTAYELPAGDGAPAQLNVDGLLVARSFSLDRHHVDTNGNDQFSDPAENVYYDGRVVAATPPGFGKFRDTSSWYEIAPK